MDRRVFCLLSSLLLASGLSACTYDDGGVENQNGKPGATEGGAVCSFKCPDGYFCNGKTNECTKLYSAGAVCEDNAMCLSGACLNKTCACSEVAPCADSKECNAGICGNSTLKKVGEACAATEECVNTAFCSTATNTCKAYAKGGEKCESSSECLSKICDEGVCGCKETSDCRANSVCDAGECREVVKCPNNAGKKCFKGLELTPNPSWSIGRIDASESDYAGSAFDFYLPNNGVVTCIYPTFILQGAQQAVVQAVNGILQSMHLETLPNPASYCDNPDNKTECDERKTAGCYVVDADQHIPFTFVERADSPWKGRNFYADYNVSSVKFDSLSNFQLAMAPAYSIEKRDESFGSNATAAKSFFPNNGNVSLVVKYEPEKCSSQTNPYFISESVSGSNVELVACKNAYQVMMEVTYRSSNAAIQCDNILTTSSNATIPDDTKAKLLEAVKQMPEEQQEKMKDQMALLTANAPVCFKSDCDKIVTEASEEVKTVKAMMSAKTLPFDPAKYYGYPGPMTTGGDYIWHNCRAGDIAFNKLTVYIELNDTDVISD